MELQNKNTLVVSNVFYFTSQSGLAFLKLWKILRIKPHIRIDKPIIIKLLAGPNIDFIKV